MQGLNPDLSPYRASQAGIGTAYANGYPPTVWLSDNYAEDWYRDALAEARSGGGHDARRREIIFATCFTESFIFEWARDKLDGNEINDYFPPKRSSKCDPRYRRKLRDKWKEVPSELHQAGKIGVCPTLDLSRLGTLIKYRDGLIHAAASRPATDTQPAKMNPFPTRKSLRSLNAGWTVRTVFDLVSTLCNQIGDPMPTYLEKP